MEILFVIKFIILFIVLVFLPVWIMNIGDISLFWKIGFTIGGTIGLSLALSGYTLGRKH